MWTPLPQILEQCLSEVYKDKGWNIENNKNNRFDSENIDDLSDAFPTLDDLVSKVEDVISKLGYDQKIADDMRAALLTRLNSLRSGSKGKVLNVQKSIPMNLMLENPVVIELEGIGDDDDKAFIIGLIFIQLYEYRRAHKRSDDLKHLLIIEEAHRLLSNVSPRASQEESNPRGKAVESFSNMLSEIRNYGQGIVVADQVPVKLSPDVIKNTNLKIAHRCVAKDDREILGGAMGMSDAQAIALASFQPGVAAVFGEGDDAPLLINVAEIPKENREWPDNDVIKKKMVNSKLMFATRKEFKYIHNILASIDDENDSLSIQLAKQVSENGYIRLLFQRFLLALNENDKLENTMWAKLLAHINSFVHQNYDLNKIDLLVFYFLVEWFVNTRGSQNNIEYKKTYELKNILRELLSLRFSNSHNDKLVNSFRLLMKEFFNRSFEPFNGCNDICENTLCFYRNIVEDNIPKDLNELYNIFDKKYVEDGIPALINDCQEFGFQIYQSTDRQNPVQKRIGLCYFQHLIQNKSIIDQKMYLNNVLKFD